jgi:bacterioferritin
LKGHKDIIELLNDVLTAELTGINQYFIHAKLCHHWGYDRLAHRIRHESIDEMKHAEKIIDRVLYLEGIPNMQRLSKVNVGESVPEQFKLDLALERDAIERLNKGVGLCASLGDNGSRDMLEEMLVSEEEHADWLETQLETIKQVGEAHYLSQQIKKES